VEIKTDDEMLVECGWSDVAREAFQKSSAYSASAPATLKASWPAHYICLVDPRGTIAKMESWRKAQGYVGRGGVARFENEVLMPMMLRHESNLRADQVQIDDAVEHLLHGVPDPVERSLCNSGFYGLKRK
jgi:hypothetical protein